MHIGRKLLILAVVLLFSYIIYLLLQKRRAIHSTLQNYYKEKELRIEGLVAIDPNHDEIMKDIKIISDKIQNTIGNTNPIVYKNYDTNIIQSDTKLKDVFMKASYNSAFTGNYLSIEMVKFCLSQGCRFLDFEVDNDVSTGKPIVVCRNNDETTRTIEGKPKSIPLKDVFDCIIESAFSQNSESTYLITNITDPLFIHIRCTNDAKNNNNNIFNSVYTDVLSPFMMKSENKKYLHLHDDNFTKYDAAPDNLQLNSCNGKVFIIICGFDNVNQVPSNKISGCNYKYRIANKKGYSEITSIPQPFSSKFQIVFSDNEENTRKNPHVINSVKNHGYTITCIDYSFSDYLNANNEILYEQMFLDFNYSFIYNNYVKIYIDSIYDLLPKSKECITKS
jgi:hypothetical protein